MSPLTTAGFLSAAALFGFLSKLNTGGKKGSAQASPVKRSLGGTFVRASERAGSSTEELHTTSEPGVAERPSWESSGSTSTSDAWNVFSSPSAPTPAPIFESKGTLEGLASWELAPTNGTAEGDLSPADPPNAALVEEQSEASTDGLASWERSLVNETPAEDKQQDVELPAVIADDDAQNSVVESRDEAEPVAVEPAVVVSNAAEAEGNAQSDVSRDATSDDVAGAGQTTDASTRATGDESQGASKARKTRRRRSRRGSNAGDALSDGVTAVAVAKTPEPAEASATTVKQEATTVENRDETTNGQAAGDEQLGDGMTWLDDNLPTAAQLAEQRGEDPAYVAATAWLRNYTDKALDLTERRDRMNTLIVLDDPDDAEILAQAYREDTELRPALLAMLEFYRPTNALPVYIACLGSDDKDEATLAVDRLIGYGAYDDVAAAFSADRRVQEYAAFQLAEHVDLRAYLDRHGIDSAHAESLLATV